MCPAAAAGAEGRSPEFKAAIYIQRGEDSFFIQVCFYFHVHPAERTCHNLNGGDTPAPQVCGAAVLHRVPAGVWDTPQRPRTRASWREPAQCGRRCPREEDTVCGAVKTRTRENREQRLTHPTGHQGLKGTAVGGGGAVRARPRSRAREAQVRIRERAGCPQTGDHGSSTRRGR